MKIFNSLSLSLSLLVFTSLLFLPSCLVEDAQPWEPVLMLEKNDAESQRPFFISYKDFEHLLSQALQNSSPYFRMEQDEWYTPFGRVERVDALSIKPTKLPNRISVLPITQDIPASDRAYFLNIYQNTKGKWITYVTEYLLEDGNSMSDVDIKSFTGRITQYSMDREILQELLIVNGSMTTSPSARTCGYRWDPYSYEICSGPVTGEEFCHDTFGYDLIPELCDTSPHDPVQIDENPWQGGGGGWNTPNSNYYEPHYFDDFSNPNWLGDFIEIPAEIVLSNGHVVRVTFGTTKDGVNANQPVAKRLLDGLLFALESCAATNNINIIHIAATTNGGHSPNSNHYKGLAMDISRINGNFISALGANYQVAALQQALEQFPHIRENFGPHIKNKSKAPFNISGHADHIHFSVNGN